jgi:hypothetical protein
MVKKCEIIEQDEQSYVQRANNNEELSKSASEELNPTLSSRRSGGRRMKRAWTAFEKSAIYHGVRKYRVGQWAKIKEDILFKQALINRTGEQIKVRYIYNFF